MAKPIQVSFVTSLDDAGTILINNIDMTNKTDTYNFFMNLQIETETNVRYKIVSITVNDKVVKDSSNIDINHFVMSISPTLYFTEDGINVVKFTFAKDYWYDNPTPFTGEGTSNNPYLIESAEHLAYLAYVVNEGKTNIIDQSKRLVYYKLVKDLELSEKFWIPIGTEENPFDGVFILNDHTIKGITLDPDVVYGDDDLAWKEKLFGLFGHITDRAQLIFSISRLPIILMIAGSIIFILAVGAVIWLVVFKRKTKIKKLATLIGVKGGGAATATMPGVVIDEFSDDDSPDETIAVEPPETAEETTETGEDGEASQDDLNKQEVANDNKPEDNNEEQPPESPMPPKLKISLSSE